MIIFGGEASCTRGNSIWNILNSTRCERGYTFRERAQWYQKQWKNTRSITNARPDTCIQTHRYVTIWLHHSSYHRFPLISSDTEGNTLSTHAVIGSLGLQSSFQQLFRSCLWIFFNHPRDYWTQLVLVVGPKAVRKFCSLTSSLINGNASIFIFSETILKWVERLYSVCCSASTDEFFTMTFSNKGRSYHVIYHYELL